MLMEIMGQVIPLTATATTTTTTTTTTALNTGFEPGSFAATGEMENS